MGNPRVLSLIAVVAAVVAVIAIGVYGVVIVLSPTRPDASPSPVASGRQVSAPPSEPEPEASASEPVTEPTPTLSEIEGPLATATRYFIAWEARDSATMLELVADPPSDFVERHTRFDAELRVESLTITPGEAREGEDTAEVPFSGVRVVSGLGRPWAFSSVLRLAMRDGVWKVLWSPETMHPSLKDGGSLRLTEKQVVRAAVLTREGQPFPRDSRAGDYFTGLGSGTAIEIAVQEVPSGRVLVSSAPETTPGRRTTISRRVQAAAARALDGVAQPAAIVAVDIETRQVRAVADTLGGRQAFIGLFPPGSTFKVVTAAALLRTGLSTDSQVGCPGTYTIPGGRQFRNAEGADRGTVSLATAFAMSCNTTFVQQAYERLRDDRLRAEAADRFGFREKPGHSYCRIRPYQNVDELGADAIGQNSVQASPLCMAEVAAAVASGVWKPALMTEEPPADSPPAVPLDENVAAGLRTMMRAVVTEGTAAQASLPSGTAGKTGTAEVAGQQSHAWFIGYRDSLAFAVFVRNAGGGATAAAPLAAKFLKAL